MPPKRVIKINHFWRFSSLLKVNFQLKTSIIGSKKKKKLDLSSVEYLYTINLPFEKQDYGIQ